MNEKIPPCDIDAEQAILGACLLNPQIIPKVQDILIPEDFYKEAHVHIAEALFDLVGKTTVVTVVDALRKKDLIEKFGGSSYISL